MIELYCILTVMLVVFFRLRASSDYRPRLYRFFLESYALIIFNILVKLPLWLTGHCLHDIYDPVIYRIESFLWLIDVSPIFKIAAVSPLIPWITILIYNYLVLFTVLAAGSECLYQNANDRSGLYLRFFITGILGYGLYALMPAIGPQAYFGVAYPDHLPLAISLPNHFVVAPNWAVTSPRNAMPSLHATWYILAVLSLRRSPVWHRIIGWFCVVGTFFITITSGEHYPLDWVVALALVILVRGLAARSVPWRDSARRLPVISGALLLGLWVLAVRAAPLTLEFPNSLRVLALISVFVPILLERRLAQAEDGVFDQVRTVDQAAFVGLKQGSF